MTVINDKTFIAALRSSSLGFRDSTAFFLFIRGAFALKNELRHQSEIIAVDYLGVTSDRLVVQPG